MTLADQMIADAALFVNPEDFGETVLYRPASGEGPFTLPALVLRTEAEPRRETARSLVDQARVMVRKSADTSVGIAAPVSDRDRMDVVFREGQAAKTGTVQVLGGDVAMWTLLVTA